MPIQFTENNSAAARLNFNANQRSRMASVVSIDWDHVTNVDLTGVDASNATVIATGGNTAISLEDRAADIISLADFGADPSASAATNTTAITAAEASNFNVFYVPEGRYSTNLTPFQAINKKYIGPGQFVMSSNGQAPTRSFVTTEQDHPTDPFGTDFFDSGFQPSFRASKMVVTSGANPASLPSAYAHYPEWGQDIIFHDYGAGFNTSTSNNNAGRSGASVQYAVVNHGGQGDAGFAYYRMLVYSTKAGATHFLANPAIGVHGADITGSTANNITGTTSSGSSTIGSPTWTTAPTVGQAINGVGIPIGTTVATVGTSPNSLTISQNATANGTVTLYVGGPWAAYLQGSEMNFRDVDGVPVSAIDRVRNYTRTVDASGYSEVWIHDRPQAGGSVYSDAVYSVGGTWRNGLDFTPATFDADKAAINLKVDDRIYLAASSTADSAGAKWFATNYGGAWITGLSSGTAIGFAAASHEFPLIVSSEASAVNGLQIQGKTTGVPPTIVAQGSDTNIGVQVVTKAAGVVTFTNLTWTLTFPAATDTVVGRATTDTLTNKSMSGSSNTFTNIPVSTAISGLGTGVATFLATPSSANLAAALTDETGTAGAVVFSASPTFTGTVNAAAFTGSGAFSAGTSSGVVSLGVSGTTYYTEVLSTKAGASTTSAALTVAGGLGVGGSVYIGGDLLASRSAPASDVALNINNTSGTGFTFIYLTGNAQRFDVGVGGSGVAAAFVNKFIIYDRTASATRFAIDSSTGAITVTNELRVAGDVGGAASHNTITGVSDVTANSTGVGTILFKGTTSRNSTGFIKIYVGTTAYYVPVFSAITG